jgi:hypothetical protein
MGSYLLIAACILMFVSLPYWLPPLVVRMRMSLFARINGREALLLPHGELGASEFRRIYAHPAASGRSRGARLSDLFWYWLAPGPEMHQEHLENGPRYEKIAGLTRSILALPNTEIEHLIEKCYARMQTLTLGRPQRLVRLRDMMMPVWADFYHELVFREECSAEARRLIVAHAHDVVTALKCCGLRHMKTRHRLTKYIYEKLERGQFAHGFPDGFSLQEQAYYLQGTFFNTAVVQMSEAMAHLLMALAQHRETQARLAAAPDDDQLFDEVLNETLRLFPLFGIAHRITSEEIEIDGRTIERGSVVCFNYPEYHRLGFDHPDSFDPDRWRGCPMKDANHIPFGMPRNRPCPAMRVALLSMRRLTRCLLRRYRFATSAGHTRSLPNRGPCLVAVRDAAGLWPALERLLLLGMKVRDRWEDAYRSVAQLVFGTIMILDARRLRLCESHFANLESSVAPAQTMGRDVAK